MSPVVNSSVPRRTALRSAAALAVGSVALTATGTACTPTDDGSEASPAARSATSGPTDGAHTVQPATQPRAGVVDAASSPHEQSLAASRALLDRTSAVVVSTATEVGAGSATARRLGLPLLVDGPGLAAELDRLGVRTVVQVVPPGDGSASIGGDREVVSSTDTDALARLSGLPHRPAAHGAAAVLAPGASVTALVEATLDAVGADRIQLAHSDPRLALASFEALRAG
ncbi:MAG TPA: hypothetical protein VLQ78_11160, partial [Ornithinibacter sp.]|nr:hypothetical protein [Ornithinibacter sp.]